MKFTLFVLSFFCINLFAAPLALDGLLQRDQRPTMAEVLPHIDKAEWDNIPVTAEAVADYYDKRIEVERWLAVLEESGPRLIAAMEQAFPGATWGFMGRDAMAIADMVEAFYIEIGQPERVNRLGVSKASFKRTAHETYISFLETHGLTPDSIKEYPYIFVDPVSGGFGRQGRTLLSAFYQQWAADGRDPRYLVGRVNMLGLIVSTFQGRANDFKAKGDFLIDSFKAIDSNPRRDAPTFFDNHKIMTYPVQTNAANEAGYTHFIGAWHESYGAMETDPITGETYAIRGGTFPIEMRQTVVWTQAQIAKRIMTPEFVERVQEEARKLGYDFPMQRVDTSSTYSQRIKAVSLLHEAFKKNKIAEEAIRTLQQQADQAFNELMQKSSPSARRYFEAATETAKELSKSKKYNSTQRMWLGLFFLQTSFQNIDPGEVISPQIMDAILKVITSGQWSSNSIQIFNQFQSRFTNFDEMLEQSLPEKPSKSLKQYLQYRETAANCLELLS